MEEALFRFHDSAYFLPSDYHPARAWHLEVDRIFLAKGSLATQARRKFVEGICALYPEAEIIKCLDTPHNRIDLKQKEPLALFQKGKRTLVFGEHQSAVRFAEEEGNTCPNFWHFSPYGFCFYGCKYCYLAGTSGVWHSPTVKIYVNLEEIVREMEFVTKKLTQPTAFYLGKLQDGLALDPLTQYCSLKYHHPRFLTYRARMIILGPGRIVRHPAFDRPGSTPALPRRQPLL